MVYLFHKIVQHEPMDYCKHIEMYSRVHDIEHHFYMDLVHTMDGSLLLFPINVQTCNCKCPEFHHSPPVHGNIQLIQLSRTVFLEGHC